MYLVHSIGSTIPLSHIAGLELFEGCGRFVGLVWFLDRALKVLTGVDL